MHFTEYLREVAQVCAEDYNIISPGALQYSEVNAMKWHLSSDLFSTFKCTALNYFPGCLEKLSGVHQNHSSALSDPRDDKFDRRNVQSSTDADLREAVANPGKVPLKELSLNTPGCRFKFVRKYTVQFLPFQLEVMTCRFSLLVLIYFLYFHISTQHFSRATWILQTTRWCLLMLSLHQIIRVFHQWLLQLKRLRTCTL